MLMPKRVKYREQFRGNRRGKATRGNTVTYGEYGLVAWVSEWDPERAQSSTGYLL